MALFLQLHLEKTYELPENAIQDDIVQAETARRTFWILQGHDNLHSGPLTPHGIDIRDVTALLPCDDDDFSFAINPPRRAAVTGSGAADETPMIPTPSQSGVSGVANSDPNPPASMLGTLVQVQNFWGRVARGYLRRDFGGNLPIWNRDSKFQCLVRELDDWEKVLPPSHRWGMWNYRAHLTSNQHLVCHPSFMMTLYL